MKLKNYIIYLPQIEHSVASAERLKQQLVNYGEEVYLFEGTHGNVAKEQFEKEGRVPHNWGLKGPKVLLPDNVKAKYMGPGVMGCFDSHYRLWKKCVELNEPIIVWEDDVELIRPFTYVEWIDVLSIAFSHGKKRRKYLHFLENPTTKKPRAEDYGQGSMPGNGGYAIKPHAAKILVDEYQNTFLPADNAINQHLVKIQVHSHMTGQAGKRPGEIKSSLIKNRALWNN